MQWITVLLGAAKTYWESDLFEYMNVESSAEMNKLSRLLFRGQYSLDQLCITSMVVCNKLACKKCNSKLNTIEKKQN